MMVENVEMAKTLTRAQQIFKAAPEEQQKLIREILMDERDVMHLRRRADICTRIYEHVRRLIR